VNINVRESKRGRKALSKTVENIHPKILISWLVAK